MISIRVCPIRKRIASTEVTRQPGSDSHGETGHTHLGDMDIYCYGVAEGMSAETAGAPLLFVFRLGRTGAADGTRPMAASPVGKGDDDGRMGPRAPGRRHHLLGAPL